MDINNFDSTSLLNNTNNNFDTTQVTEGFTNLKYLLTELGQGLTAVASELSYPLDTILKLQKKILLRMANLLEVVEKQTKDIDSIKDQLEKIRKNQQTIFNQVKELKNE